VHHSVFSLDDFDLTNLRSLGPCALFNGVVVKDPALDILRGNCSRNVQCEYKRLGDIKEKVNRSDRAETLLLRKA
jgi:hypothetical protein